MSSPGYTLGWKEHVALPEWGLQLRAKLDTGARTSALHVRDLQIARADDGSSTASFDVVLGRRSAEEHHPIVAPVVAFRRVRDTGARSETRAVVRTRIVVGRIDTTADITLTDRSGMNFRMLLGRRTLEGLCAVDPGRGYVAGRPVVAPAIPANTDGSA
ncbi:MAG: RimK/LysX family protein [Nitriliruptoraceae bacterium]